MATKLSGSYHPFSNAFRFVFFSSLPPYPYTMHEHFELFYVKKGTAVVTIDEVTVTLQEGDMALTAPFMLHKNDLSPQAVVEVMNIAPHLCPEVAKNFGSKHPLRPYLRSHELTPLVRELLIALPEIIKQIKPTPHLIPEKHSTAYLLSREECSGIQAYLTVLLLELTRNMTLEEAGAQNADAVQKLLQYCTANFNQEITRETVAQHCNVSVALISQTFHRMGTSFRDYVNTLRINRAYQLLTTTKKPITEIIYECGYSNQGTFNRNFQLQFGKSPRDIRHGR